jgi:hypothetical protein
MKIETLKFWSGLSAMALLFGAMNLVMYSFLPLEFIRKYARFEAELPLFLMLLIIAGFGLIPAAAFSLIFRRYGEKGIDKAAGLRLFFRGSGAGFIGSIFLGVFCLKGLGQTNFGAVGIAILSFLILMLAPSMVLGGIARIKLPESRFINVLITAMIFAGGMSSYLSLKAFIHLFFSW